MRRLAFAVLFVAACKGDPGPAGPTGTMGDPGAVGPTGPQGPQGAMGAMGSPGSTGAMGNMGTAGQSVTVAGEAAGVSCANGVGVGVYVNTCMPNTAVYDCACNAGDTVVSGGAFANTGQALRESRPNAASQSWRVTCMTLAGADTLCPAAFAVSLSHAQ